MSAFQSVTSARARFRATAPLRLQFEIARRCGAWEAARRALARLLELMPVTRFWRLASAGFLNCAHSKPSSARSWTWSDPGSSWTTSPRRLGPSIVVPAAGAQAARVGSGGPRRLRGNTALVQGARGPTADRTARAVREVLKASQASARRMALGRALEIRVEGSFGALTLKPGSRGASAAWTSRPPRARCAQCSTSSAMRLAGRRVMKDILSGPIQLPGVKQAAVISSVGVPVCVLERFGGAAVNYRLHELGETSLEGQRIDPASFVALAASWVDDVMRAGGQTSGTPEALRLTASQGSLVSIEPDAHAMVVLEPGTSTDLVSLPLEVAVERLHSSFATSTLRSRSEPGRASQRRARLRLRSTRERHDLAHRRGSRRGWPKADHERWPAGCRTIRSN